MSHDTEPDASCAKDAPSVIVMKILMIMVAATQISASVLLATPGKMGNQ